MLTNQRKFTSQRKTKRKGGKANESDEYIITNTPGQQPHFQDVLTVEEIWLIFDYVSELSLL